MNNLLVGVFVVGALAGLAYLVFLRAPSETQKPVPGAQDGFKLGFQLALPNSIFDDS